jgi:hypothetical protein
VLLAILVTAMTIIAARAYPLWDDGGFAITVHRGGAAAVIDWMRDRPVLAWMQASVVESGHLIAVEAVVYWLTWFGTGWVTLRLWKILCPSCPEFAMPAACLSVAPVIVRVETTLISGTWVNMIGPLLTWLVLLKLLAPQASKPSLFRARLLIAVMMVVVAAATMISEYALATVIAGAVLLASLYPVPSSERRQAWATIGLLLLTAGVAYAVYHHLGNAEARPMARPELQNWGWRLTVLGPRWLSAIWEAGLGGLLTRIGEIDVSSRMMLVALLAGLAGAVILRWIGRQYVKDSSLAGRSESRSLRILLTLLLAIAAGLAPIVAMGATVHSWTGSRFWGPLLPLESCFCVFVLWTLLRRQFLAILPAFCGLLAGYYIINDGFLAIRERAHVVQLGDRLESFVPDNGFTVAFVSWDWEYPARRAPSEGEINARLTWNWPQAKRQHFFAFAGDGPPFHQMGDTGYGARAPAALVDPFGANPRLSCYWCHPFEPRRESGDRRPEAPGNIAPQRTSSSNDVAVTRLLWVTEGSSGELHVELLALPLSGSR